MISRTLFMETKKLVIYDFDDTLVKSKSFIFVNHKNGKKSKLTPGQFAVYNQKDGDEFDFSDFRVLREPTEIKHTTDELRKAVKKHKGKGVYVLTARSVFGPIQQYLKDIGLGKQVKVIALSSGYPDSKAEWIEYMIDEKGYDEVYFADDSPKNVKVVKDMLKKKGVPHKVELIKEYKKPPIKLKKLINIFGNDK